jgi:Cu/Ag efflux protein CusF
MKTSNLLFTTIRAALIPALAMATSLGAIAGDAAEEVPVRGKQAVLDMVGFVKAVDLEKREITVTDEVGMEFTFAVGDQVDRLNDFWVGDKVKVAHTVALAFELRAPTAEELANPLQVEKGGQSVPDPSAPEKALPPVTAARAIKAVCTIEALDPAAQTVTIRGPKGAARTIKVEDASILPTLKVGQQVVAYYVEAVAIALEKVKPDTGSNRLLP